MVNALFMRSDGSRVGSQLFYQGGFSLLEMGVVLVVVGLLLGGSLIPLSVQMEKQDRDATEQQLQDIREALIGFALTNGRLPCPDTDNDGQMNGLVTCANSIGAIPWVDLGLGQQDAWGQPFTYRVSGDFADSTDGTICSSPATTGISFSLCSVGDISVLDAVGGNPVALTLPAIVLSHGKNWATTTGSDEAENSDADAIYVARSYSNNTASPFDDLMIWLPPAILKNKMLTAELLP